MKPAIKHPFGGALYELQADGTVLITDGDKQGLFKRDGRWISILSGLMRNDEVVLAGAYELKLASQQSGAPQKGGHFHADGTFHEDH